MNARRRILTVTTAVAAIVITLWFVKHERDRREAAKRESGYQIVLGQYEVELKPGMAREQVEQYLRSHEKRSKRMCCVANFQGKYVSFDRAGYDDLVKIADESVPFVCSENNVYIALEFNPKSEGELPKRTLPIS
jgi:hypothetical protein